MSHTVLLCELNFPYDIYRKSIWIEGAIFLIISEVLFFLDDIKPCFFTA